MVKLPKRLKRYCPYCKTHTENEEKLVSKGKATKLKKIFRHRQENVENGYGGFPYANPAHRSRGRKNPSSRKQDMKFTCKICGKVHQKMNPIRGSKIEFV